MPYTAVVNSFGDRIQHYTEEELIELYISEGKTEDEAKELAAQLFEELKLLNNRTRNVWRRARNR
ncbi:MAG: hypothetical protein GTO54_12940 [Nitrososphaeria archaeon]|nr:hypothetical protein [Nitrososphaeria archaeon]